MKKVNKSAKVKPFKQKEAWLEVALSEVAKVTDCKHRTPLYIEKGVPVVSPGTIKWGEIDLVSPIKKVSEEDSISLMDHCHPTIDDLVFSRNQSVGIASYIKVLSKFVLGQDTVLIQPYKSSKFIYYSLQTVNLQNQIKRLSGGSTFSRINLKDIRALKLKLPQSYIEQQKIANFLTVVDDKISLLKKKHNLLETYKKGVMQQIFNQHIRFKDGSNKAFPDWKIEFFSSQFDWVRTNSLSREKLTTEVGKVQNIHYGDIHIKFAQQFELSKEVVPYVVISEEDKLLQQADYCQKGDLIIADASEDYADIGKAIEIIDVAPQSLVAGLHTYIARPKTKFSSGYLGYLFQDETTRKQIKKLAQGVSVLSISKTNLATILLPIPDEKEQQKIAQFLQSIDKKIEAVARQIDKTKEFKKGLLQQMFV